MSATDRDNARNQHYDYWTVTAYVTLNSVFNIVITDSSNRIYSNNYSPRLSGNSNYKFPPAVIGSSHFWEWKVNSGAEIATINFVG